MAEGNYGEIRDAAAKALLLRITELAPKMTPDGIQALGEAFASVVYPKG